VAESSITIEGVGAVVDSGLARIASHSPWSGLPTLQVARISQASANQRAGRAGRTGPGRVVRLYPAEDFARRPAHDTPEIARADLAPAALLLNAMGAAGLGALEWLDAPPAAAVEHAEDLLRQLGAFSPLGQEMARYPLHPRLARLIVEARRRGVAEQGATIAALLSAGERLPAESHAATRSDLLVLMESQWAPATERLVRQVHRIVRLAWPPTPGPRPPHEDALLISVLAAFPDRVARRREASELQLAAGGPALLAPSSTVTANQFLVAVEAEDRREQKAPLVRIASGIEPEWLLDLFPERVRETALVEWNRAAERVEAVSALMFDHIAIESHRAAPDPQAAHALLTQKAMEAGVARFADPAELEAFLGRVDFASQHGPLPPLGKDAVERALISLASGLKSFSELEAAARGGGLLGALERQLPPAARRLLDEIAPERIRLSRGRHARVHYQAGQPPSVASRLQDFFGMRQTPAVARGAVPLVLLLLAPNQRPVQTTSDLAGFWERLYPQVRKELARRYPKHAWPEDPLA
jgi:ATP-dependent helicase HrpB